MLSVFLSNAWLAFGHESYSAEEWTEVWSLILSPPPRVDLPEDLKQNT